jgi:hypothetical protein
MLHVGDSLAGQMIVVPDKPDPPPRSTNNISNSGDFSGGVHSIPLDATRRGQSRQLQRVRRLRTHISVESGRSGWEAGIHAIGKRRIRRMAEGVARSALIETVILRIAAMVRSGSSLVCRRQNVQFTGPTSAFARASRTLAMVK